MSVSGSNTSRGSSPLPIRETPLPRNPSSPRDPVSQAIDRIYKRNRNP